MTHDPTRRWRWVAIVALAVAAVASVAALRDFAAAGATSLTPATVESPTADSARAAAQSYADAWWMGDAQAWRDGLTADTQARYTLADIERLLAEDPDRWRSTATGARLIAPGAALVTFGTVDELLVWDGTRWRWHPRG